jgi:hypothetical protein
MALHTLVPHSKVVAKYRGDKRITDVTNDLLVNKLSDLIRSPDVLALTLELLYLACDGL